MGKGLGLGLGLSSAAPLPAKLAAASEEEGGSFRQLNVFPQCPAGYPSLPPGLCSNVTSSEGPSLTIQPKAATSFLSVSIFPLVALTPLSSHYAPVPVKSRSLAHCDILHL